MPGDCSDSRSKRISASDGMPRSMSAVSVFSSMMTLRPEQCGQGVRTTFPRPPHSGHVSCIWTTKPGAICWFTMRTPRPPQARQFCTSPSFAPVPRHLGQMTLRLMRACRFAPLYRSSSDTSISTCASWPLRRPPPPPPKKASNGDMAPPPPPPFSWRSMPSMPSKSYIDRFSLSDRICARRVHPSSTSGCAALSSSAGDSALARTSYALATSVNFLCAASSPGFLSVNAQSTKELSVLQHVRLF
jgi:hypothetical protein